MISTQVIADDDRDDDALYNASESIDPKSIKLGQGDVCEGLEVAVLAMRPGEGCIVTCDGAYGDPCYAVRKVGLGPAIRAEMFSIGDFQAGRMPLAYVQLVQVCVEINQCVGGTAAVLALSVNRHRHAIEQASRRWRGGRGADSARRRREYFDFYTGPGAS